MNPTLKDSDILYIIPYNSRSIRIGDIIVFLPPEKKRNVAHRVISVDEQGIRTKGDNNCNVDSCVLNPDDILGRVVYAQRRNRRLRIYGGLKGRLSIVVVRTIRIIKSGISSLLRPVYHRLSQSGIFRNVLSHRVKTQVLCFRRPNGMEMQLLVGQWVIGRRLPGKKQWQIRRPFRLVVDEASLPGGEPDYPATPELPTL